MPDEKMVEAGQIVLSPDSSKIAILAKNGILWIGLFWPKMAFYYGLDYLTHPSIIFKDSQF